MKRGCARRERRGLLLPTVFAHGCLLVALSYACSGPHEQGSWSAAVASSGGDDCTVDLSDVTCAGDDLPEHASHYAGQMFQRGDEVETYRTYNAELVEPEDLDEKANEIKTIRRYRCLCDGWEQMMAFELVQDAPEVGAYDPSHPGGRGCTAPFVGEIPPVLSHRWVVTYVQSYYEEAGVRDAEGDVRCRNLQTDHIETNYAAPYLGRGCGTEDTSDDVPPSVCHVRAWVDRHFYQYETCSARSDYAFFDQTCANSVPLCNQQPYPYWRSTDLMPNWGTDPEDAEIEIPEVPPCDDPFDPMPNGEVFTPP